MDETNIDGAENQFRYAGFGVRLGAFLLDWIYYVPLAVILFFNDIEWKVFTTVIIIQFMMFVYRPLMQYWFGGELGKLILGLRVRNLNGEKVNLNQVFIRALPFLIIATLNVLSSHTLYQHPDFVTANSMNQISIVQNKLEGMPYGMVSIGMYILLAIMILVDSKHQGFHDKTAKTIVIYKN